MMFLCVGFSLKCLKMMSFELSLAVPKMYFRVGPHYITSFIFLCNSLKVKNSDVKAKFCKNMTKAVITRIALSEIKNGFDVMASVILNDDISL